MSKQKKIFNFKKVLLGLILFFLTISLFLLPSTVKAQTNTVCAVYFTGIGCPHCAKTDPLIFGQWMNKYPDFIAIEYEIYHQQENGPLMYLYNEKNNSGLGIPLIIFDHDINLVGDSPILDGVENILDTKNENKCLLSDGSSVNFNELDINSLLGFPKIWRQDKVLIKQQVGESNSELLRLLILNSDINQLLQEEKFVIVEPEPVALSGNNVIFQHAIKIDNWLFQWNGQDLSMELKQIAQVDSGSNNGTPSVPIENSNDDLVNITWTKIISLAAVDAVNPCALAVLILMLTAILAYNPNKRRNIIWAGLAFIISIFIMYLIYGLVIIKFFQIAQTLSSVRFWLYRVLGIVAIILGILNIRDFFKYKPGGLGTEMPLFMRPKVKKIIESITSIKGAFGVGIFVTLFLLPCTIGPYIIAGGILSAMEILETLPSLLLYNLIFVSPMLIIVAVVYLGFKRVDDISAWKEKNITKLHLVAGFIMLVLGLAMILGWV